MSVLSRLLKQKSTILGILFSLERLRFVASTQTESHDLGIGFSFIVVFGGGGLYAALLKHFLYRQDTAFDPAPYCIFCPLTEPPVGKDGRWRTCDPVHYSGQVPPLHQLSSYNRISPPHRQHTYTGHALSNTPELNK